MATIRQFEEIEAWKQSRRLTCAIYQVSNRDSFRRDFGLRDQIRRASVSIMANIAEGFERDGNKEFVQFLYIAKASAGEVRSHLYVALDQGYITCEEFTDLSEKTTQIGKTIQGLIRYLSTSDYTGMKYRP